MTVNSLLLIWAWFSVAVHSVCAVVIVRGVRSMQRLRHVAIDHGQSWPTVSIVFAARNEERNLAPALASLCGLDYPRLEIVAVDDRSTDRTGALLEEFASRDPRIQVIHIRQLPAGWLGKNHALHQGAMHAHGELILFTDADVVFSPGSLQRAVTFLQQHNLDLLAAFPHIRMPNLLLQSFAVTFMLLFFLYFQPWRARVPSSRAYIGVGAFTLVRSSVYKDLGGHAPIAMRPDDDVKLGQLFKLKGKKTDVLDGVGEISVPWYTSLREVIRGLEKNAFAGVDYRVDIIVGSSIALLLGYVAPFVLIFATDGLVRAGFAICCLLLLGLSVGAAWSAAMNPLAAFGLPLTALLFVIIQWRTMLLTLYQGGIWWRDTFYPLKELKENRLV